MKKGIALFLLLIAFGCKNESATSNTDSAAVTGTVATAAPPAQKVSLPAAPAIPRMVVRTADISIVISDTTVSIEKITAAVGASGGYVSDSKLWRDHEQLRGSLTLRVPAAQLDAALAAVRRLATRVQSEAVSSEDVSQEYVDLDAQVRNLEAAETEMRSLMTTVTERTHKASDIIEIYQQLTQLRGQIEQAKGRMRFLSQQSAMSTIRVDLVPDAIAQPVIEPGWQPVAIAKDASRALVHALQGIATLIIWIAIYVLPIVALLCGFALLAWRVTARLRGGAAATAK